jgi:hypothetical protein
LNSYAYANDNPVNRSDPSGKFSPPRYAQGYLQGLIQQAINITKLVIALSTNPGTAIQSIGGSIYNAVSNPQATVQSAANAAKNYAGASDYEQSRLSGYYGSYLTTFLLAGTSSRAAAVGSGGEAAGVEAMAARAGGSGEGALGWPVYCRESSLAERGQWSPDHCR